MTYVQIANLIKSIGVPFSYYQFDDDTSVAPPFICYFYPERNDVLADDTNYQKVEHLIVELYTENKDFALEQKVEEALTGAGLVYTKDDEFLDDEKMHEAIYETEIVITEE